jgi:hypothetical protein
MDTVSIVEFVRPSGNYRIGERAGFARDFALQYVQRGAAKMIKDDVPRVDPALTSADGRKAPASARAV